MPGIISQEEVKKVAALARIKISEKEEVKFSQELNSILEYFKDLSLIDTDNVGFFDHYALKENQFRDDLVEEASDEVKENIRTQFPRRKGDELVVGAVLNAK